MVDLSHDDIEAAAARHRDRQFAELVTLVIGMAAINHPEELRTALGTVFDVSAIEETDKRIMLVLSKHGEDISSMTKRCNELQRLLNDTDGRMDELKKRLDKAGSFATQLMNRIQHWLKKLPQAPAVKK